MICRPSEHTVVRLLEEIRTRDGQSRGRLFGIQRGSYVVNVLAFTKGLKGKVSRVVLTYIFLLKYSNGTQHEQAKTVSPTFYMQF